MDNKTWFKTQAKFGMMIHWGLYSILGGEYKGERMGPHFSEWAQSFFEIPCDEYNKLTKAFNPIYFDAEEWVKCAKDAGMTYIVVTSKHHDGFALFKSEASDFNVVDATPFKRDIIKELSDACRKYGLKFGLYYSQELDWHEFNGGGYDKGSEYDEWIESFDGKVKLLVLLGQTSDKIEACARKHGFEDIVKVESLEDAVKVSAEHAEPGEAVLLSPACASWGLFKSYEQRGDLFKEYVRAL